MHNETKVEKSSSPSDHDSFVFVFVRDARGRERREEGNKGGRKIFTQTQTHKKNKKRPSRETL